MTIATKTAVSTIFIYLFYLTFHISHIQHTKNSINALSEKFFPFLRVSDSSEKGQPKVDKIRTFELNFFRRHRFSHTIRIHHSMLTALVTLIELKKSVITWSWSMLACHGNSFFSVEIFLWTSLTILFTSAIVSPRELKSNNLRLFSFLSLSVKLLSEKKEFCSFLLLQWSFADDE